MHSARAAGAPPEAIQSYLRVIGRQISVSRDIRSGDEFDIIVDYQQMAHENAPQTR